MGSAALASDRVAISSFADRWEMSETQDRCARRLHWALISTPVHTGLPAPA
jgi:hypothetical protein